MKQNVSEDIEKAYPEAYRLARKFHDAYEAVAPQFGYTTRPETIIFDPASPNGRTMAHVCFHIVQDELEKERERIRENLPKHTYHASECSNILVVPLAQINELLSSNE